jgi:hypothetical protein
VTQRTSFSYKSQEAMVTQPALLKASFEANKPRSYIRFVFSVCEL